MPTIAERIYTVVNAAAIADGGVFTDEADGPTTPNYIVYTGVGGDPQETLASGLSIRSARYQFDCWSALRKTADAMAESLITLLRAQTGLGANFGGVTLQSEPLKDFDPETVTYRTIVDVLLWYYP